MQEFRLYLVLNVCGVWNCGKGLISHLVSDNQCIIVSHRIQQIIDSILKDFARIGKKAISHGGLQKLFTLGAALGCDIARRVQQRVCLLAAAHALVGS